MVFQGVRIIRSQTTKGHCRCSGEPQISGDPTGKCKSWGGQIPPALKGKSEEPAQNRGPTKIQDYIRKTLPQKDYLLSEFLWKKELRDWAPRWMNCWRGTSLCTAGTTDPEGTAMSFINLMSFQPYSNLRGRSGTCLKACLLKKQKTNTKHLSLYNVSLTLRVD